MLVARMEREQQAMLDPGVRAGRLIDQLKVTFETLAAAHQTYDHTGIDAATQAAQAAVNELARDKPAQSALRNHPAVWAADAKSPLGRALREPDAPRALALAVARRAISQDYDCGLGR